MKKKFMQQEILLMTGTTFSQRQWAEKNGAEQHINLSCKEQMEEACWNGMLQELLPGIIEKSAAGKILYLWEIRQGESFLEIDLCEYPASIDKHYSIDPYTFPQTILYN